MTGSLEKILQRAESWPDDARHELEQLAQNIEAELGKGTYRASASELAGIDRGLRDAASGKFVSAEQMEKMLGKLRP
jgi:predicted transcriptional regulator